MPNEPSSKLKLDTHFTFVLVLSLHRDQKVSEVFSSYFIGWALGFDDTKMTALLLIPSMAAAVADGVP